MKKKPNTKVLMQQKQRRRKMLTFWRIVKYGVNSFVRNAWLSVAATVVMTITLVIILGSFFSRTILNKTIDDVRNKVDISIYLKKQTKDSDIEKIRKSMIDLGSVREVAVTSPKQAREKFAVNNISDEKINKALIEAEDSFSWIINVKLHDIGNTDELRNFVDSNQLTKNSLDPDHKPTYASSRKEVIDNIARTAQFAEKVGLAAGLLFTVIASLIIFNTIRMAIFNRREEIYMMKLIGANKSFISGPFLIEAVICGLIAAVFASSITYWVVILSKESLQKYGIRADLLTNEFQNLSYLALMILAAAAIGSMIGVVSSFVATRKYLKI